MCVAFLMVSQILFFNCTVSDFKNLQSLEICSGGLTDAGVKNIKDLSSLTLLNLSQNSSLTDKTLQLVSGKSSSSLLSQAFNMLVFSDLNLNHANTQ